MSRPLNENIYELIAKKFSGQSSSEEDALLNNWIDLSRELKISYEKLKDFWSSFHIINKSENTASQEKIRDAIWEKAF